MQGINVFATTTARDAAITAPAEGQFAFTKDTNSLWYYDGAAWVASGATGDIEGVSVTAPITGGGTSGTVTIGISSSAVVPTQTGNAGKYLTTDGTNSSWAAVASGATTWTQRMGGEVSATWYGVAYNGSDLYVVYGSAGKLYTSPDGITWTSRTSGFGSTTIFKVIYANSLWVAVGNNGTITTSTDGITWTARTANMSTNLIRDVIYGNSLFVAVGAGGGSTNTGGITYSTDGITWTRKSQSLTVGTTYYGVIYNGTNWIVAAAASTNNYLYASSPSGTWTVAQWGGGAISEDILGIWYDGTRTIAASASYWSYSTSTTIASLSFYDNVQPSGLTNQMQNAYYYNAKMYQKQFGYAMDFSTTPGTNLTSVSNTKSIAYIEPTAWLVGGGLNYVNAAGLFVGAVGTIMLGNYGQIYTSF
jgi:hypothetical protein